MPDLTRSELDAIHADHAKLFTRQWFTRLFLGQLPPGDTFWAGNYGPALFAVPVLVLVALFTALASPGHLSPLFGSAAIIAAIYRGAILLGLIRSVRRAGPGPRIWHGLGLTWTLLETALLLWLGLRLLAG